MSGEAGRLMEISVEADGEAAEAICELFERYGGGAVVELRAGEGSVGPRAWVRTYLPAADVEARTRVEIGLWHLSRLLPIPEPLVRELAEANWAEAWKAHYAPLDIGRRFRIVPSWLDADGGDAPSGRQVLRLDPGMAFGTGLHPTTQLCVAALERYVRPGAAVLDVGTGSGILAIAAARLGAARVVAVDTDPQAIAIARTNAVANAAAIDFRPGTLDVPEGASHLPLDARDAAAAERFDVVVANILAATIIDLAPALAAALAPDGVVVASGILVEQTDDVVAGLLAAGLSTEAVEAHGDWVALAARRRPRG